MEEQIIDAAAFRAEILDVMQDIMDNIYPKEEILCVCEGSDKYVEVGRCKVREQASYVCQRKMINDVFRKTGTGCLCKSRYSGINILLRLVVIDSLYSTNSRMNYFTLENMACTICSLGSEKDANDYFYSIAKGGRDAKKLFSKEYGMQKNTGAGTMHISLMSKYAYYSVHVNPAAYPLGFPIYDKLARKTSPKVFKKLGVPMPTVDKSLKSFDITIEDYVKILEALRAAIFGQSTALFMNKYQQFDVLDAYLWRMGKFDNGNLSLLLNESDYKRFVENLGLANSNLSSIDQNVIAGMKNVEEPFAGTSAESYMTKLYKHWLKL